MTMKLKQSIILILLKWFKKVPKAQKKEILPLLIQMVYGAV